MFLYGSVNTILGVGEHLYDKPGLGLLAALLPLLFMSPAKKEARASFWVLPSADDGRPPGPVGSGVW